MGRKNDWCSSLANSLPSSSVESLSLYSNCFSSTRLELLASAINRSRITHLSLSFEGVSVDIVPLLKIQPQSKLTSLQLNEPDSTFVPAYLAVSYYSLIKIHLLFRG
jgi:hypothetical protein